MTRSNRARRGAGADRKVQQLCAQVARALSMTLAGECDDEVLQNVVVESVQPVPDATRLEITLRIADPGMPPAEVAQHVDRASGRLRLAVGDAVRRRRVPDLVYRVLPPDAPD